MGLLEVVGGQVTAPGSVESALTAFAGQSFQVRDFKGSEVAKLLGYWYFVQGNGISKIRSPRLHDNVQGIRTRTIANTIKPVFFEPNGQNLVANDILIYTLSGSATAGDIESAYYLVYYSSLDGVNSRFTTSNAIKSRIRNILSVEVSITAGTSGNWSGTKSLIADFDLLKANSDYAVLGYRTNIAQGAICLYGIDTGNLRVGGPGSLPINYDTSNYFYNMSEMFNLDCIPLLNSNNKSSIYVEVANNENAASPIINFYLAELY